MVVQNKKPKTRAKVDVNLVLANERTLLAWVRTGITLIAGGVAVAFLASRPEFSVVIGVVAILFGGLICLLGYWRYRSADQALRSHRVPDIGGKGILFVVGAVVLIAVILVVARGLTAGAL